MQLIAHCVYSSQCAAAAQSMQLNSKQQCYSSHSSSVHRAVKRCSRLKQRKRNVAMSTMTLCLVHLYQDLLAPLPAVSAAYAHTQCKQALTLKRSDSIECNQPVAKHSELRRACLAAASSTPTTYGLPCNTTLGGMLCSSANHGACLLRLSLAVRTVYRTLQCNALQHALTFLLKCDRNSTVSSSEGPPSGPLPRPASHSSKCSSFCTRSIGKISNEPAGVCLRANSSSFCQLQPPPSAAAGAPVVLSVACRLRCSACTCFTKWNLVCEHIAELCANPHTKSTYSHVMCTLISMLARRARTMRLSKQLSTDLVSEKSGGSMNSLRIRVASSWSLMRPKQATLYDSDRAIVTRPHKFMFSVSNAACKQL
eukprot:3246-Heterococcus_DN1.PRE.2